MKGSPFSKIAMFNTLIGNTNAASLEGLRAQFEMVREEFDETEEAIRHLELIATGEYNAEELGGFGYCPQTALRDGIADVLVTVYGLAHRAGINADADLMVVHESNMSKFIVPGTDIAPHMEHFRVHYGLENVLYKETHGWGAFTSGEDQTGKDGKFYPVGKLLKPMTFHNPVLPPLVPVLAKDVDAPATMAKVATADKPVVNLHNAQFGNFPADGNGKPCLRLSGYAQGHPARVDGFLFTSRVVRFDHEEGTYETRNTVYVVDSWLTQ